MVNKKVSASFKLIRRSFIKKTVYGFCSLPILSAFLSSKSSKGQGFVKKPSWEEEKKDLIIHSDRPLNLETPMHLLDDEITPSNRLFVRNNGNVPPIAYGEGIENWRLTIDGEVEHPLSLSLHDLKTKFKAYTFQLVIECGGNGRKGFYPPTEGTKWTYGAVGCPLFTGILVKDILKLAGLKSSGIFLAYYGMDTHLSGDATKPTISRGCSIKKALDPMTIIAYEMNGKPLPPLHGFPARLICPGYPASASGKWLQRLWIRNQIHDGPKMESPVYMMPNYALAPGTEGDLKDFSIIEKMPVRSTITFPASDVRLSLSQAKAGFCARGFAWAAAAPVKDVSVSIDYGKSWYKASLRAPKNPYAWQRWEICLPIDRPGYYQMWARALDQEGDIQPMIAGNWNPKGYLNNAMPRIAFHVV